MKIEAGIRSQEEVTFNMLDTRIQASVDQWAGRQHNKHPQQHDGKQEMSNLLMNYCISLVDI